MDKIKQYHEDSVINDMSILRKNFNYPLDRSFKVDDEAIEYKISMNDEIEYIEKLIIKTLAFHIIHNSEGGEFLMADFEIAILFKLTDLEKYVTKDEKEKAIIDLHYNEWLDNICLATCRGIIFSELRGTFLSNAILPLINPVEWHK